MNITVYLGAATGARKKYAGQAAALGSMIGARGHRLIYGGSRVGLMGVLADACLAAGGEVIGVEPAFFVENEVQHAGITELIVTQTMAERRAKMIELGDAFIAFPGGTGTLEEISEVISMNKLGLLERPAVLLDLGEYYAPLRAMFLQMAEEGFLPPEQLEKIHFSRTVEEAVRYVEECGKKRAADGTVPAGMPWII